jgi:internalin A
MVLIVVIGAGLGWVVRSAQIQRDAVAAIRGHGGFVRYDGEEGSGIYLLGGKLSVPRWLVDTVGVDYFDSVFSVYLRPGGSASDLHEVGCLSRVKQLRLFEPFVTDAGLAELRGLKNLYDLDIGDTDFTCTGRVKRPAAARVTDAGLRHLLGLSTLSYLNLSGTQITDAGLEHLERLNKLEWLCLDDTLITDAGLAQIEELSNLEWLYLRGAQITDAGLVHLRGLTKLRELDIADTRITDAGLVHLTGLTELRSLHLSGTRVSNAGSKDLAQALPRVHFPDDSVPIPPR